jgi:hypothetical protein
MNRELLPILPIEHHAVMAKCSCNVHMGRLLRLLLQPLQAASPLARFDVVMPQAKARVDPLRYCVVPMCGKSTTRHNTLVEGVGWLCRNHIAKFTAIDTSLHTALQQGDQYTYQELGRVREAAVLCLSVESAPPLPQPPTNTRAREGRPLTLLSHNRKGRQLCHAVGCGQVVWLLPVFGGSFCVSCAARLAVIRGGLIRAKAEGDSLAESVHRQAEIEFRKYHEFNHMLYQADLERRVWHQGGTSSVAASANTHTSGGTCTAAHAMHTSGGMHGPGQ